VYKLNKLKDEVKYLGILFLVSIAILKTIFYKESLLVILRLVTSFFWLLIIPGWIIMQNWGKKINFTEKFILSIALGTAIVGISSYYLGLMGIHIKYQGILIPAAFIILESFILFNKKNYQDNNNESNEN
jgi:uncharacterized membrane protein